MNLKQSSKGVKMEVLVKKIKKQRMLAWRLGSFIGFAVGTIWAFGFPIQDFYQLLLRVGTFAIVTYMFHLVDQ